jgi:hypothetical protein
MDECTGADAMVIVLGISTDVYTAWTQNTGS